MNFCGTMNGMDSFLLWTTRRLTRLNCSFRRTRFNWPSKLPGRGTSVVFGSADEENNAKFFNFRTANDANNLLFGRPRNNSAPNTISEEFEDLTHVRTLRVFHAVKVD